MKLTIKSFLFITFIAISLFLINRCGTSTSDTTASSTNGGEDPAGSNEETGGSSDSGGGSSSGGTATLSGTLVYTSGSANLAKASGYKTTTAVSYKAIVLNTSTGGQAYDTVASDGTFSFTVSAGASYVVSFIDSSYNYVGTLATSSVGSDSTVPIALTTGSNGTTTNLGTVTANTTTGQVISDQTLTPDTTYKAMTSGEIVAGGKTGEGTTNYESSSVTDSIADASDPDDDNDGTPDVFDTDNDNDSYADEIDGTTDYCGGGTIKLYIENYPGSLATTAAQTNFPTPSEIGANIGGGTQYQIHLEVSPASESTISDISEVSVTAPSYIDSYGYVYDNYTNASSCFNQLWTACNSKKLILSNDGTKYEVALGDTNLSRAGILSNMYPGDTFIFTITMADSTKHICTKKINLIPKYYAYNLKKSGTLVDTSQNRLTGWSGSIALSWSVPNDVGPKGLTYKLGFVPYNASCNPNASAEGFIVAGQDATSKTITPAEIQAVAASPINLWMMKIWNYDDIGDAGYTGGFQFTSDSSSPSACGS